MSGGITLGIIELTLEDLDERHDHRRIAIDAVEDEDRVELTLMGFGRGRGRPIALTRDEAEKLAAYLCLACSRGKREKTR